MPLILPLAAGAIALAGLATIAAIIVWGVSIVVRAFLDVILGEGPRAWTPDTERDFCGYVYIPDGGFVCVPRDDRPDEPADGEGAAVSGGLGHDEGALTETKERDHG